VIRQCLEEVRREFDAKSVEAFELFAWKGLPAQRVAEELGVTPNAVFIAKHRIMKRIKDLLPRMEEIW
jgi:RNA polymerase sigma-70 factor (ECF subfamily)